VITSRTLHYQACERKVLLLNLLATLGAVGAKAVPPTINRTFGRMCRVTLIASNMDM
jgi:hypothetical protein